MGEHLNVMAVHVRMLAERGGSEATAGATLMQARAHLTEKAWRAWVEREIAIPVERARELMALAERSGASLDSLKPREFNSEGGR